MNLSFIEWYVGQLKLAAIKTPSGPIVTPKILATALECPEETIRRFLNDNKTNFEHLQSLSASLTPAKEVNAWIEAEGLKANFHIRRFKADQIWLNHYSVAEVLYRSEAASAFKTRIEFTKMLEKTWKENTVSIHQYAEAVDVAEAFRQRCAALEAKCGALDNRVEHLEGTVQDLASHLGRGLKQVGEAARRAPKPPRVY